jgi:hypothetical protein
MVMVSWPELVCATALEASRHSRPTIQRRSFIPPKLKLQLIISRRQQQSCQLFTALAVVSPEPAILKGRTVLTCDPHHYPRLYLLLFLPEISWSEVQVTVSLGTLVFRVESSLSGTLQTANGTSVTIGNRTETLHFGQFTRTLGNRSPAAGDVNKVFIRYVPE